MDNTWKERWPRTNKWLDEVSRGWFESSLASKPMPKVYRLSLISESQSSVHAHYSKVALTICLTWLVSRETLLVCRLRGRRWCHPELLLETWTKPLAIAFRIMAVFPFRFWIQFLRATNALGLDGSKPVALKIGPRKTNATVLEEKSSLVESKIWLTVMRYMETGI